VVPIVETPALPQGSTSAVIDLTVDDPPSNKGNQKANIETIDAPDRPSTSEALGDASNPSAEPFFALDDKDEVQD
jgi:hypothetical protein